MLWRFLRVYLWCWYGFNQVVWVVSLDKNWRCPLSWTWRLLLITHCWIKALLPTYLMWALPPLRDSLCGLRQPQNAFCFSWLSCFTRCIQTIRTWYLFVYCLAHSYSWRTWLSWSFFWCVYRHCWLGVNIYLQMKCSNASCTWGISSVACNWGACMFTHPLIPWLGGLHFIIFLPVLSFFAVSSWWVLTRPLMPVLFPPFFLSWFCWMVALSLSLCVTVCCALVRLRSLSVWMLLVFCVVWNFYCLIVTWEWFLHQ